MPPQPISCGTLAPARPLRVAYFTDSYAEMNGLARTSRELVAFAERHGLPLLCIMPGERTQLRSLVLPGDLRQNLSPQLRLTLHRSSTSIPVDAQVSMDPLLGRHVLKVRHALRRFKPDVIHVSGPGDIGSLGALFALHYGVPLVASWHHNLHELAAQRLQMLLQFFLQYLPLPQVNKEHVDLVTSLTERGALETISLFYRLTKALFAPNPELREMLADHTGRPVHLMPRGVDTELFHPRRRLRQDGGLVIGYSGRLQPEKNIRLLLQLQSALANHSFRFHVIGDGMQRAWLQRRLRRSVFHPELPDAALAQAYANMDLMVNPSLTDTFGTATQEAMACGTPAVVMNQGGPQFLIESGVNGFVAKSEAHFVRLVRELVEHPDRLVAMRPAAHASAVRFDWEHVLSHVWRVYESVAEPNGQDATLSSRWGGGRLGAVS